VGDIFNGGISLKVGSTWVYSLIRLMGA